MLFSKKKPKKKRSKKSENRELDEVWKRNVKLRDNFTCQICKKKVEKQNCQAHHILPKGIKGMRWDVDNGITLCFNHHRGPRFSPHINAIWFTYWLKTNKRAQFKHAVNKLAKLSVT